MKAGICSIKYFKYLISGGKYLNLGKHFECENN